MEHNSSSPYCSEGIINDFYVYYNSNACGGLYDPCKDICHKGYDLRFAFGEMFPEVFAYPVYGIAFPILLTLLVIANIFVVLVLSKKHMASPTNTVLFYMAISDLFVGVVPFPFTFFYYTLGYYGTPHLHRLWWCYTGQYLMSVLPPVCHGVAIWLTVLLAAQRYIYIQYPMAASKWCTIPNVRRAAFVITVLSMVSGVLKIFEVSFMVYSGFFSDHQPDSPNMTVRIQHGTFCAGRHTIVVETMTTNYFYNLYMWTRVIGFLLVPSVILILLNIFLIFSLRAAQKRRNRLLKENRQREANRQKESNSTNLMLVIVVSIFLIVNLPQAIFMALLSLDSTFNLGMTFYKNHYANLFVMVDNMLIMATYPVNFAIYCSMSTQFRDTFMRIFCTRLPPINLRQTNSAYLYLPINRNNSKRTKPLQPRREEMLIDNGDSAKNGICNPCKEEVHDDLL